MFNPDWKNRDHGSKFPPKVQRDVIIFRVSRRRREMYCGYARLCVCLSVCLSATARIHYCTEPDVTWGVVGDAP